MSQQKKMYICSNIGCDEIFDHPMKKKRHLERNCKGKIPEKSFDCKDGNYKCVKCGIRIKHFNNFQRKNCGKEKKSPVLCSCITCGKQFRYLSKLTLHLQVHDRDSHICEKCHCVFKHSDHFEVHVRKCDSVAPSMILAHPENGDVLLKSVASSSSVAYNSPLATSSNVIDINPTDGVCSSPLVILILICLPSLLPMVSRIPTMMIMTITVYLTFRFRDHLHIL